MGSILEDLNDRPEKHDDASDKFTEEAQNQNKPSSDDKRSSERTENEPSKSSNSTELELTNPFAELGKSDSKDGKRPAASGELRFDEKNFDKALKTAVDLNKPLISIVSKDGKLDPNTEAALKAHSQDAVFLTINNDNAASMRQKGMNTSDFWSLANLSGANNDLSNIKSGFVGKLDPQEIGKSNAVPHKATNLDELFTGKTATEAQSSENLETNKIAEKALLSKDSFNENNVLAAIDAAKSNSKPILSINVGKEGLSAESKAQLDNLKNDFNVLLIDRQNAAKKMEKGLPPGEFWTLANLMGAKGEVNQIKDNSIGTFSASDLSNISSKDGSKGYAASFNRLAEVVDSTNAAKNREEGVVADEVKKPTDKVDSYDFNQGSESEPDFYDFSQGDASSRSFQPSAEKPQAKEIPTQENVVDRTAGPVDRPAGPADRTTAPEDKPAAPQDKPVAPVDKIVERPDQSEEKPGEKSVEKTSDNPKEAAKTLDQVLPKEADKPAGPVKLDKLKFDTTHLREALETAKKNNLPVVVYKGADFCGNCPPVSAAIDQLSDRLKQAPNTEAVVVKLNWETAQRLQNDPANKDLAKLVDLVMPMNGSSFPDVKVFNPNDILNAESAGKSGPIKHPEPLKDSNHYAGEAAFLNDLVSVGKAAMQKSAGEQAKPEVSPTPKPNAEVLPKERDAAVDVAQQKKAELASKIESKYETSNVAEAVRMAKEAGLPLAVHIGAPWCGPCRTMESQAWPEVESSIQGKGKAVVLHLDIDQVPALKGEDARLAADIMQGMGGSIPELRVGNFDASGHFNVSNSHQGGLGADGLKSFLQAGGVDLGGKEISAPSAPSAKPVSANLYNERSVLNAAEYAKQNNKPLINLVSDKADPNVRKAFEYLNSQKLAAATDISKSQAKQMMDNGLDTRTFQALISAVGLNQNESAYVNAVSPDKIKSDMSFAAAHKPVPKSASEMMQFLKDSGVDLSNKQHEQAVMALLEGKPIPEAKAEVEEAKNVFKAKTAADAEKILKDAKEKNLEIVVHAPTEICENNKCSELRLDVSAASSLEEKAIFLEIPKGGIKGEGTLSPELEAINAHFKIDKDDHKTAVDAHVFKFGKDSKLEKMDKSDNAAIQKLTTPSLVIPLLQLSPFGNRKQGIILDSFPLHLDKE